MFYLFFSHSNKQTVIIRILNCIWFYSLSLSGQMFYRLKPQPSPPQISIKDKCDTDHYIFVGDDWGGREKNLCYLLIDTDNHQSTEGLNVKFRTDEQKRQIKKPFVLFWSAYLPTPSCPPHTMLLCYLHSNKKKVPIHSVASFQVHPLPSQHALKDDGSTWRLLQCLFPLNNK